MRRKNYKGRCEKRNVPKCEGVCKTYDSLQSRMVDILSEDEDVKEIFFICIFHTVCYKRTILLGLHGKQNLL